MGLSRYTVDTIETAAVDWKNVKENNGFNRRKHKKCTLNDENENVFVYSPLSHVYKQGSSIHNVYFRIGNSYEEGMNEWKKIKELSSLAILKAGGTISHRHGVGLDHKNYLVEKGELRHH